MLDRHFALAGSCVYSGDAGDDNPSGWMIEFDVEQSSFASMYVLALSAYLAGKPVRVDYDDAFGGGTTCRITNIVSE